MGHPQEHTRRKKKAALVGANGLVLQTWPHRPTDNDLLAALLEQAYEQNKLLAAIDRSLDGLYSEASNVDHTSVLQSILEALQGLRRDVDETASRIPENCTTCWTSAFQAYRRRRANVVQANGRRIL